MPDDAREKWVISLERCLSVHQPFPNEVALPPADHTRAKAALWSSGDLASTEKTNLSNQIKSKNQTTAEPGGGGFARCGAAAAQANVGLTDVAAYRVWLPDSRAYQHASSAVLPHSPTPTFRPHQTPPRLG